MSHTGVVIAAGGLGSRMSAGLQARANVKQLLPLAGRPVLWHGLTALLQVTEIREYVVVCPPDDLSMQAAIEKVCQSADLPNLRLVPGGAERQQSVLHGIKALSDDVDLVAIHDGARPLVDAQDVQGVLDAARTHGAATLGAPVSETLAEADDDGWIRQVPRRDRWWRVQTPQAFERTLLLEAHTRAQQEGWRATDDAGLVRRLGGAVRMVPASHENIKLTTPTDLRVAAAILSERGPRDDQSAPVRVGIGYDIHRLAPDRELVLGGVKIPSDVGLEGHSDADVVLHAVMDALLGAAGEGDIGQHFPNTDPQFSGVSSAVLLTRVRDILARRDMRPGNVDVAVVAEAPKLATHVEQMVLNISSALGLPRGSVAVKATTHERLGALGRGEGIAAWATATVIERANTGA